ncbi:MAG: glutathione S-transferase family protein [Rhizobiales bacterium]|nr:glutathione S-transferase family protein [Hyphomicrobiales bacterium]
MKIFGDIISPFVRMTLVCAHEAGLGEKVVLAEAKVSPVEANGSLVAVAPLGKIPVLITDHGHAVYDSRVIMEYLCHVAGNSTLIPDDGVKRFRVLTLQALAQGMGDASVGYRYETGVRPKELQWAGWIARQRARVKDSLDDLDRNWSATLAEVNVGSIAVAVVLDYIDFRMPDWAWAEGRQNLKAFHADFSKRPSMTRYPLPPK